MDDRKLKILSAVVNEYIVTGEPVGERTLIKGDNGSRQSVLSDHKK